MSRSLLFFLFVLAGIAELVLAIGFALRLPWAIDLWPLPDGRLSFSFMGAILAGSAMPLLWIGLSQEIAALRGYALGFSVMYGGIALTAFATFVNSGKASLLAFGLLMALLALVCVLYLLRAETISADSRSMPRLLRISFAIEVTVLTLVGIALILAIPNVLPWPLQPVSSVMYGWVFGGLALYFGYSLAKGSWVHTRGQLMGFLAYDLFLVGPLAVQLPVVKPEHLLGLIVALAIIVSSGALAVYYLLINPTTRIWSAVRPLPRSVPSAIK